MPTLADVISRACFGFVAAASLAVVAAQPARAQAANTTFFLTSVGIGNGGNLGGLAGADNYCQTLAQAAGAGAKTWRAYLSTQAADGAPAVNARDRIGKGPGRIPRASRSPRMSRNCTAPTISTSRRRSRKRAKSSTVTETSRTGTTFLRDRSRTGRRSAARTTAPAKTGRAVRRARRWSVTPISADPRPIRRSNPGTPRIPRAGRTAAARRPTSRAPAATACCIVLRRTDERHSAAMRSIEPGISRFRVWC